MNCFSKLHQENWHRLAEHIILQDAWHFEGEKYRRQDILNLIPFVLTLTAENRALCISMLNLKWSIHHIQWTPAFIAVFSSRKGLRRVDSIWAGLLQRYNKRTRQVLKLVGSYRAMITGKWQSCSWSTDCDTLAGRSEKLAKKWGMSWVMKEAGWRGVWGALCFHSVPGRCEQQYFSCECLMQAWLRK